MYTNTLRISFPFFLEYAFIIHNMYRYVCTKTSVSPNRFEGCGTYIQEVLGDDACLATYGVYINFNYHNPHYRQCKGLLSQ